MSNSFECTNRQRIDKGNVCNGDIDCSDGSDETVAQCIKMDCAAYAFQCIYGACVPRTAECNGIQECADNSDELSPQCPAKASLSGLCLQNQFQCDNGECILGYQICDGSVDCEDKSDEILKYCAATQCPRYAFRCGYGGCIARKRKCDGNIDCIDGSDEAPLVCNAGNDGLVAALPLPIRNSVTIATIRPTPFSYRPAISPTTPTSLTSGIGCQVSIPENGDAIRASDHSVLRPNAVAKDLETVLYNCTQNHYSDGVSRNLCVRGAWQSATPKCVPRCSPLVGVTISTNCFERVDGIQKQKKCEILSEPGTSAIIICQPGYERNGARQTITCDRNGRWNPLPNKCAQTCGKQGLRDASVETTVDLTKVPWNVSIYKQLGSSTQFEQHCSGTIISAKIIVSAIHCFWNPYENKRQNLSEFKVTAGKTLRDVTAIEPYATQFFSIDDVAYKRQYRDYEGNYEFDVAVVILNKFIVYTNYISPVCIEIGLTNNDQQVQDGLIGTVSGWGLLSNDQRTELLKIVQLPAVSNELCKANTPSSFHPLITNDKFCAGHLDKITVCAGDSGAGFITTTNITNGLIHYLRGIVSTGNRSPCGRTFLTTFTNIAYYSDFINGYYLMYQPLL